MYKVGERSYFLSFGGGKFPTLKVAEDEKGQTDCFIYFLGASEIVGIL
jgi:hypothetical protein